MQSKNLCGPQIKHYRLERDIKLADLSARLKTEAGISLDRTNLGRAENGLRAVSDIELVAFAKILGVSILDLLPMVQNER